ncbi:hypothetical protein GALMADRAFT_145104 [Galerina marginata CBS 339.88]|uniref:NACHT domain-containing protein n=1 Tax=Galerina marginata (strain CBS 339.88) TaxID=685588 RepID=A0A067SQX4_GALM3|nr:hypothetical protein GALMADRAFT_145104 [Galerina marginata CBS 339.88]
MTSNQRIHREFVPTDAPMFQAFNAPIMITGGTFNNMTTIHPVTNYPKVIQEAFKEHIAPNATHDTNDVVDPPRCHPKTREAILQKLRDWLINPDNTALLVWLFGPAGAGKTAIARSLAYLLGQEGLLAASFFFFGTANRRNNEKFLITTIAYQLAFMVPEIQPYLAAAVEENPLVFQLSLESQLEKLIINPVSLFSSTNPPRAIRAIIIDGLDECRDRDAQRLVLDIIQRAASRLSTVFKFFLLSRPEHHIESVFRLPNLLSMSTFIDLKKDLSAYDDIRLFLQDRFDEIKATHPLNSKIDPSWPGDEAIEELVRKSSGNFIYPQTVMKYIEITYGRPQERLDVILGLSPNLSFDRPFAELDNLYHHILSRVRLDHTELSRLLGVLLASTTKVAPDITSNRPPQPEDEWLGYFSSTEFIERVLFLKPGDIETKLIDLRSLIGFDGRTTFHGFRFFTVNFLHTSFPDFLLDPSRSGEFAVTIGQGFTDISLGSLKRLAKNDFLATRCECDENLSCRHNLDSEITHYLSLFWSSENATPSQELRTAMLDHDSMYLFSPDDDPGIEDSKWVPMLVIIERFLDVLQTSLAFKDSYSIFRHHISIFHFVLKADLAKCAKYHIISDAVALFSCLEADIDPDIANDICDAIKLLVDPQSSLNLGWSTRNTEIQDLISHRETLSNAFWPGLISGLRSVRSTYNVPSMPLKYFLEFLRNPEQSGCYHVNNERLILATMRCLSCVSSPSSGATERLSQHSSPLLSASILLLLKQMWDEVARPNDLADEPEGEDKFYYRLKSVSSIPKDLVSILRRRPLLLLDPELQYENKMVRAYKNLEKLFEVQKYLPTEPSKMTSVYKSLKGLLSFQEGITTTSMRTDLELNSKALYLVVSPLYHWFLSEKASWSASDVVFEFDWFAD